jgi:hypothetical protein
MTLINAGTKWTIEEDNNLIEEIKNNKSYEEIALEHKRTITAIKSRVISHIIYPKYKDDIDYEKISIEYKIDKEIIMRRINKLREKDDIMDYLQKINTKLDILLKNYNLNF